jgi:acyl carrier protein
MASLQSRLATCFAAVFPELTPQEIPSASMGSLASWDSVAGITLLSVIEEEFSISVSPDDVSGLVSFGLILDYLGRPPRAS